VDSGLASFNDWRWLNAVSGLSPISSGLIFGQYDAAGLFYSAPMREARLRYGNRRVAHLDTQATIDALKQKIRKIAGHYNTRHERTRRLFVEERAASLHHDREREYCIKRDIAKYFSISYGHVCFCGSAQLGLSITKETLFQPAVSDLDAACVDIGLYQRAWAEIIEVTQAFTDYTPFGHAHPDKIRQFKDQMLRRGMIKVSMMPDSGLKREWSRFQDTISRQHHSLFGSISIAIYMNEYAFCWKQDSALSQLMR
jgi:hypothetical protein